MSTVQKSTSTATQAGLVVLVDKQGNKIAVSALRADVLRERGYTEPEITKPVTRRVKK